MHLLIKINSYQHQQKIAHQRLEHCSRIMQSQIRDHIAFALKRKFLTIALRPDKWSKNISIEVSVQRLIQRRDFCNHDFTFAKYSHKDEFCSCYLWLHIGAKFNFENKFVTDFALANWQKTFMTYFATGHGHKRLSKLSITIKKGGCCRWRPLPRR